MTDKWKRPDSTASEIKLKETSDNGESSISEVEGKSSALAPVGDNSRAPGFTDMVEIASGASGTVYAATRIADGAAVAVKIFKKDLTPNSDAVRRFEHEVATLSKLSHPNIVRIMSTGVTADGESFMVMELAEGVSIRTLLETEGVFSPQKTAQIAREICRALEAAHAEGIIHRDLKPNNIVLDKNNRVKVVDFGIAKALGSSSDTITQYGAIIGTPNYMSPEQCLGDRVEQQSDIYSLGCTLFEMLTGNKAFDSLSPVEAIAKHVNADRSFIKARLAHTGAPVDLQKIIIKCVERESANRYKSISELEHDLSCVLLNKPLAFSTSAEPLPRPNSTAYALFALLPILLIGLMFTFSTLFTTPAPKAVPAPEAAAPHVVSKPFGMGKQVVIKSRDDGKVLFTDPTTTRLSEALVHAAEQKVSLSHADLRNANLIQMDLTSADLSSADLTGAQLIQAKLTDVDLHDAVLSGSRLTQATLMRVNLKNAKLDSSELGQCRAPGVNLSGADLSSSRMVQAGLQNASCIGTNFSYAELTQATFDGANCTNANFNGARVSQRQMRNCVMRGARISYER